MTEDSDTDKHLDVLLENRFRVISALDKGGVGSVFRGRDEHRSIDVAIKFLIDKPQGLDEETIKRFKQEALLLNDLNHNNVVHVYAFGWHRELGPYLILEYVRGNSIESLIQSNGAFSIEDSISLLLQICHGLVHAHQAGVVHRDLKPANLMVVEEDGGNLVKILDFGIGKRLEPDKAMALTQPGHIFGSPLYMSPEQCQGEQVDERSDIYSLGCVAYEMVTGSPPLVGDTWLGTVIKHVTQMPEPPQTVCEDVPQELDAIIMRCLQKKKADRFQTVVNLMEELKALSKTEKLPAEQSSE